MTKVFLGGRLTAAEVARVAAGAEVAVDSHALERAAASRATLETLIEDGCPIYGITTGLGALVTQDVEPSHRSAMQADLLRSHACGSGEELNREIVRAALVVRLNGLLKGRSGVRPVVIDRVVNLLNARLTPVVPRSGSLGASGDLAPSAHAFLPLIGEGHVRTWDDELLDGPAVLARLRVGALALEANEGLALINGTQFMAAIGAILTVRVRSLLDTFDLAAAMTVDALRGARTPFDERIHELRSLDGQQRSARRIASALAGSTRTRLPGDGLAQDAYSLRCAPQVHGAAREAFAFFERLVAVELDAVTDNPLIFEDPPVVLSGGNFHGQALALAFDTLRLGLADLGSISERRIFRLVSPALNGSLPAFLTTHPGASSGYMVVQYAAAALVSELRALAHPVSTDSIPTSDNQEDHVSMGMTGAVMALQAVDCLERIVTWELICAAQALDLDPGEPGRVVASLHAAIRECVPPLVSDRPPAYDLALLQPLVSDGLPARLLGEMGQAAPGAPG
jgi:histidine ammonia-lyase